MQKRVTVVEEEVAAEVAEAAPAVAFEKEQTKKVGNPVGQLIESIEEDSGRGPAAVALYTLAAVAVIAFLIWLGVTVL